MCVVCDAFCDVVWYVFVCCCLCVVVLVLLMCVCCVCELLCNGAFFWGGVFVVCVFVCVVAV